MLNPAIDRRVVDCDAALGHHRFKIAVADRVSAVPAYGPKHDFTPKVATLEIAHPPIPRSSLRSQFTTSAPNFATEPTRAPRRGAEEWRTLDLHERTKAEFCRVHGISPGSLSYWRGKCGAVGFVRIEAPGLAPGWDVELEFGDGMVLRLRSRPALLRFRDGRRAPDRCRHIACRKRQWLMRCQMTWFGSVATSVITALIVVWLTGFLNEIFPSPQRAWLALQNHLSSKPQRAQDGFRIVLCWLQNDRNGEDTGNVEDAFSGVKGITLVRSYRTVTATGAADEWRPSMQRDAVAEMEKWNADVAIVGVVKKPKEALSLWFVPRSGGGTLERGDRTYKLEDATLGADFHEDLRAQLIALAWDAVSPLADTAIRDEAVEQGLRASTQKLANLLGSPNMGRTEQWAALQLRFGQSLSALGEREGETDTLERAINAYRAALDVYTRERWPLRWAEVQAHLGIALKSLGVRESGIMRLEQAANANLRALEVFTREQRPLEWAAVQGNLGIVFQRLGHRESGTRRLELAVEAARTALEVFTPRTLARTVGGRAAERWQRVMDIG